MTAPPGPTGLPVPTEKELLERLPWLGRGKLNVSHYWVNFDGLHPLQSACGIVIDGPKDNWYPQTWRMACRVCKVAWNLRGTQA